jgi:hypothetical protein
LSIAWPSARRVRVLVCGEEINDLETDRSEREREAHQ